MPAGFSALILAAGRSRRMPFFKPLLPLGQEVVLERVINNARHAGIEDILVVTGFEAESLAPLLAHTKVRVVHNRDYSEGMYSSLRAGVRKIKAGGRAFFVMPGDIPLVAPATLSLLIRAFAPGEAKVVYPRHRDRRGHPPLLPTTLIPDILEFEHEGGLRVFLAGKNDAALDVDCEDAGVLKDMDTEEDYRAMVAAVESEATPSPKRCHEILRQRGLPQKTIAHCEAVARLALAMAEDMNRAGRDLDGNLVLAGGLLHDLAKGERDHAAAAGRLLRRMGYHGLAHIAASHIDPFLRRERLINETTLVSLADKLVKGTRIVSLDERFAPMLLKFADDPQALAAIRRRLEKARRVRDAVEKLLGQGTNRFKKMEIV